MIITHNSFYHGHCYLRLSETEKTSRVAQMLDQLAVPKKRISDCNSHTNWYH